MLLSESSTFVDDAKRCTLLPVTPTLLSTITDTSAYESVRAVFLGGEAPPPELIRKWWTPQRRIWNAYGPTEATISITMGELLPETPVTLGHPIRNSHVTIRDEKLNVISEIGVSGEMCIAGEAVLAAGYYNNPEQTTRKFVTVDGQRIYRTGDMAKQTEHGLVFLGRQDQMVKNRGFLINVKTEVVEAILSYSNVQSATALMHNRMLVAFVTPASVDVKALRCQMSEKYDQFLVPDEIHARVALPQSSNGKIDDAALRAELMAKLDRSNGETNGTIKGVLSNATSQASCLTQAIAGAIGIPASSVQPNQSFADLGGNSLSAIKAVSMIRQAGFSIPFQLLFQSPDIESMLEHVQDVSAGDNSNGANSQSTEDPINGHDSQVWHSSSYPMTDVQRAMIRSTISEPPLGYMLISLSLGEGRSDLDLSRLRECWQSVLSQHELFQANFDMVNGSINIGKTMPLNWQTILVADDAWHAAHAEQSEKLLELACGTGQGDLFEPQTAFGLLLSPERPAVLLWLVHHALIDGWSVGLIINQVRQRLFASDTSLQMVTQFAHYARAVKKGSQNLTKRSKQFWKATMTDMLEGNVLNTYQAETKSAPGIGKYGKVTQKLPLSIGRLQVACQVFGFSPAVLLHASWALVLSKYSGTDKVVFGSIFSGRGLAVDASNSESIVGPLINTCPFPVHLRMGLDKTQFLRDVQTLMLSIADHQWSASRDIQEIAPGSLARLLTTALFLEYDLPISDTESQRQLGVPVWSFDRTDWPEFDLTIQVQTVGESLALRGLFKQDQYDSPTISRLLLHLENTLLALLNTTSHNVGDVYSSMLQPPELFNLTHNNDLLAVPYSGPWTLKEAFELGVKQWPTAIAIEGPSPQQSMSYEELDVIAASFAQSISGAIKLGDVVAILGDGSREWLISVIAVIKAGAVYLPLDIKLPTNRMSIMVAAASATLCIYPKEEHSARYQGLHSNTLSVPDQALVPNGEHSTSVPDLPGNPDNDAYVMFTSGTTGKPKGIKVTHRAALSHLAFPPARMHARPGRRHAQVFSPGFDVNIAEIFGTLCYGATLVLKDTTDPYAHLARVDAMMITPSLLGVLPVEKFPNLDTIYLIGEAVPQSLSNTWSVGRTLYNFYGPCECTIAALYKQLLPGDPVTLGGAIPRVGVYILDRHLQPVPVGVVGEIFLSGVQVMKGYLGQDTAAVTARAFLQDPFMANQRMYRTGDLGAWTETMEVLFLGRVDHQVKVRGYRIELAEIQNEIQNVPGITVDNAVALVIQDTLYAALTPDNVDVSKIVAKISKVLPSYAVPQRIVAMSTFPITVNQKLDRQKLAEIITSSLPDTSTNGIAALLGETEVLLEGIWKRTIVGLSPSMVISPDDDFFALGGNSLAQITVAQRICTSLNRRIPFSLFVTHTDLRSLAAAIDEYCAMDSHLDRQSLSAFLQSNKKPAEASDISHLEKSFIDMHENCPTPSAFNVAHVVTLTGQVDILALEKAVQFVADRIESLRARFLRNGNTYLRQTRPIGNFPIAILIADAANSSLLSRYADTPFHLEDDYLTRIAIVNEAAGRFQIIFAQHHLVTDQTSIRLFFERVSASYISIISGKPLDSNEDTDCVYSQWALWKKIEMEQGLDATAEKFWVQHLQSTPTAPEKRLFHMTDPLATGAHAPSRSISCCDINRAWPIDVFVSSTAIALNKVLGCNDLRIGIPFLDRVEPGSERIFGVFLDTLPVHIQFANIILTGDPSKDMNTIVPVVQGLVKGVLSHAIPSKLIQDLVGDEVLFDVMLVLNRREDSIIRGMDIPGVQVSTEAKRAKGSKFPLLVEFMEKEDGSVAVEMEYFEEAVSGRSVAAIMNKICCTLRSFKSN